MQPLIGYETKVQTAQPTDERRPSTDIHNLFVRAGGVLKKELQQHLHSERTIRKFIRSGRQIDRRGQISNAISIEERPQRSKTGPRQDIGKAICRRFKQ